MATRTYHISFDPAKRTERGGYSVSFDFSAKSEWHEITTDNLDTLAAEVRRLAYEYGQTCHPSIRVAGRKPPGFDKMRDTLSIIDYVPET